VLEILREELVTTMQLAGCADIASISSAHVKDRFDAAGAHG
jgi:isopentenyl diphosphate isomerase/L-lactate dehydrogenase-like FMN-dependent dehydrogenase